MHKISLFMKTLLVAGVFLFFSCDKDYNVIGEDLIGKDKTLIDAEKHSVKAYNQLIKDLQSNNLPSNPLGFYKDNVFGETTANFVTQLSLSIENPYIPKEFTIDDVVLKIPYFYKANETKINSDGSSSYVLDSVYKGTTFKLSVYESGVFLNNLDPASGNQTSKKYYTNQDYLFDLYKKGTALNDALDTSENNFFYFKSDEIVETIVPELLSEPITKRYGPAMQLRLNKSFGERIIKGFLDGTLSTNDKFRSVINGLYFKVEKNNSSGNPSMAFINFSGGTITITYHDSEGKSETQILNLTGNSVSLLTTSNAEGYQNFLSNNPEKANMLYVKGGGNGTMSVVKILENDKIEELQNRAKNGALINEANLIFHVDMEKMPVNANHPQRLYLYDLTNKKPLLDYTYDGTTGVNGQTSKQVYSGILDKSNPNDYCYKFRITSHIKNIITDTNNKDNTDVDKKYPTNVNLGLVVAQDINAANVIPVFYPEQDISLIVNTTFKTLIGVPRSTIMSQLGTVLYGGGDEIDISKRLQLQIYYTQKK